MLDYATEWGNRDAPTVILLAGGGGTRWLWTPHADYLCEDYHVVALDLPAHGTHPEPSFSVERAVRDVGEVLEECGRGVLVGHSIGGQVAMEAAAAHETRVVGLFVAGVSGEPNPLKQALMLPLTYLIGGAAHIDSIRAWMDDKWGLDDERQLPPSSVDAHDAAIALARAGRGTLFSDPLPAAATYDGPMLLAYGKDEISRDAAEEIAERVEARLRWYEGGHSFPSRNPAGFATVFGEFLDDIFADEGAKSSQ